jgi:hypothetical protein
VKAVLFCSSPRRRILLESRLQLQTPQKNHSTSSALPKEPSEPRTTSPGSGGRLPRRHPSLHTSLAPLNLQPPSTLSGAGVQGAAITPEKCVQHPSVPRDSERRVRVSLVWTQARERSQQRALGHPYFTPLTLCPFYTCPVPDKPREKIAFPPVPILSRDPTAIRTVWLPAQTLRLSEKSRA